MVWFIPSECQKEKKKKIVPYLSLFCLKLSVLLHSQTVSLWLVETVIREKRFFEGEKKKSHHPHTAPRAARGRNEGGWLVTYGTMSCSGLAVSGARVTDRSWPSAHSEAQPREEGEQGLGGEGALAALGQFIQEGSSAPFWRIPPLYLATSLPVSCRVFFSR